MNLIGGTKTKRCMCMDFLFPFSFQMAAVLLVLFAVTVKRLNRLLWNLLSTNLLQRQSDLYTYGCFNFPPVSKYLQFCGSFSLLKALSEVYCSQTCIAVRAKILLTRLTWCDARWVFWWRTGTTRACGTRLCSRPTPWLPWPCTSSSPSPASCSSSGTGTHRSTRSVSYLQVTHCKWLSVEIQKLLGNIDPRAK